MDIAPILLAGLGIGIVFGVFGAGGSAFATPVLALIGVPAPLALASPLPALLPAALAGARRYLRSGQLDRRIAMLAIVGGLPGTLLGTLASRYVDGARLLLLSGVMLLAVGARILLPDPKGHAERCAARRRHSGLIAGVALGVGLLTGLLANGGGFLLVPVFILLLGLSAGTAAGTSMVAVGVLTVPTLVAHAAIGHVDWRIAAVFAIGVIPGSELGARLSGLLPPRVARLTLGVVLVVFATWFVAQVI